MNIKNLRKLLIQFSQLRQQEHESVESFFIKMKESGKNLNNMYGKINEGNSLAIENFVKRIKRIIELTFKFRLKSEIRGKLSKENKLNDVILQAIKIEKQIIFEHRKENLFSLYGKRRRI